MVAARHTPAPALRVLLHPTRRWQLIQYARASGDPVAW